MDRGVALALRGERDFGDARQPLEVGHADAELARSDHQRALGRIALHGPSPFALAKGRIVGERRGAQRLRHGFAMRRGRVDLLAFDSEIALGNVTAAADLDDGIRRSR